MIDDVQWQVTGVPASVKSTLEVLIPIQDFASGITLGRDPEEDLDLLAELSMPIKTLSETL